MTVSSATEQPLLQWPVANARRRHHRYERRQRAIDVAAAAAGLIVLGPVILACAAWVKLMDGGPVFYRQWRVGRDGWLFRIWKLRTMVCDAENDGARLAHAGDPRVLPGCGWMRKSHVDELPQLWNILCGHMSVVGPRPERPEIHDELLTALRGFDARIQGRPGLTGLAQVRNGYTNDLPGMRRKLALDRCYLRRRSVRLDLWLILSTAPKLWDRAAA
jgi:lipopolysaccharide/colanic/teichoic acid biosynthesis glycosyltransferase